MEKNTTTSLGEVISELFREYLELYQDNDLASVATAATLNDLIAQLDEPPVSIVVPDQNQAA